MNNYAKLLSFYIETSGKTLKDISKELLEQYNLSVDTSYISKLKTGTKPPASEEISRALANVLNYNSSKLVFAGYLEKAPVNVQEYFSQIDLLVDKTLNSLIIESTTPQLAVIIEALRTLDIDGDRPFCFLDQIKLNELENYSRQILLDLVETVLNEEMNSGDKLKIIPILLKFFMKTNEELYVYKENYYSQNDSMLEQHELLETARNLNLSVLFLNGSKEIVSAAEARYLKQSLDSLRNYKDDEFGLDNELL